MTEQPSPEQQLRGRIAELEQERAEWYAQRKQLIADLEEQAGFICDAWKRLESERRSEMQARANSAARTQLAQESKPAQLAPVIDTTNRTAKPAQSQNSANPTLADQFKTLQREVQHATTPHTDANRSIGENK